jgi:transposase
MPTACELTSRLVAQSPTFPNMIRRKKRFRWTKALYRKRNNVERFFNKLKFRRIHSLDKLGESHERCTQTAYPA